MKPFTVISLSDVDGYLVAEFDTRESATAFADEVAHEGMSSTIFSNIIEVPAVMPEPEDFGVIPGIDFPATLHRPFRGAA